MNSNYKIKNEGWNQDIKPGDSVDVSFTAGYNGTISIPEEYQILGKLQDVDKNDYEVSYKIAEKSKHEYGIEVTIKNISDKEIEDWKLSFELNKRISKVKNAILKSHENNTYYINNDIYNSSIKAGESVNFRFHVSTSNREEAVFPSNEVLKQVTEEYNLDLDWDNKMINADSENVIAARNQVNDVVKVALIDSGVNYSEETNVVGRKNFLPGYSEEDSNPMFDDFSGHGSAVAALLGSDASQPVADDQNNDGTVEDGVQETDVDFSYLTDNDKITLTPKLDEDLVQFYADQGEEMYTGTVESEPVENTQVSEGTESETAENVTLDEDAEELDKLMNMPINGINPNVEIYSARVLDENNEAPVSRVIEAIEWAIEQKVNIINISWGVNEDNPDLHAVIKKAYQNGILIIAAAGNGENIQYPAKYEEAMAVGSVKCTGEIADASATGKGLEVVAPGQDIVSYGPFGIPDTFSGTSMAAPQVTGLASILWQKDLTKSNEFIRQLIDATARNLGDKNIYGYGLIDCEYAISQYDTFAGSYVNNNSTEENVDNALEDGTLEDNSGKVDTFAEATINGSWGSGTHTNLVARMDIVRLGAVWADQPESGLKGMTTYPGFHGYYQDGSKNEHDYIAAYIYLTEQAASFKTSGTFTDQYTAQGEGIDDMHTLFKNNIGKAWEMKAHKNYTNEQKARFVYGMALHTVGDIFAHSTFSYKSYKIKQDTNNMIEEEKNVTWARIGHGKLDKNGNIIPKNNKADNTEVYSKRYNCALEISKRIIKERINNNTIGTIYDFSYSSTYKININKVGQDSDVRVDYLKNAFCIEKFNKFIVNKISDTTTYETYIDKIEGVSLAKVKAITNNWTIVYLKFSDKLQKDIDSKKTTIKIYKMNSDGKNSLIKPKKSGDNYILVLDKNTTYRVVAITEKKEEVLSPTSNVLSASAISTGRYVCTKDIYISDDDQSKYLESENYKTMCLGTELVLDETDFVTASLGGKITIADTDSDYSNDKVLSDAKITLKDYNDNSYQTTAMSDDQGMYKFSGLAPGIYKITIQKEGYMDIPYTVIIHSNENNVFNPVIAMISKEYEGNGSASGNIVDAVTGKGVEGLTLRFRKGLNETKDTVLIDTKTGANGSYVTGNLATGYYTVQIMDERLVEEKDKYQDSMMTVRILGGYSLDNQNGIVNNANNTNGNKINNNLLICMEMSVGMQEDDYLRQKDTIIKIANHMSDSDKVFLCTYYESFVDYIPDALTKSELLHTIDEITANAIEQPYIQEISLNAVLSNISSYMNDSRESNQDNISQIMFLSSGLVSPIYSSQEYTFITDITKAGEKFNILKVGTWEDNGYLEYLTSLDYNTGIFCDVKSVDDLPIDMFFQVDDDASQESYESTDENSLILTYNCYDTTLKAFSTISADGYIIDWGDGKVTKSEMVHVYEMPGEHTIKVSFSNLEKISFLDRKSLVKVEGKLNGLSNKFTSVKSLFYKCTALQSVSDTLFNDCTEVTDFSKCFSYSSINSVPDALFYHCIKAIDFSNCFSYTNLTIIPDTLFVNCTEVKDFSYCFDSTNLNTVSDALFINCTKVIDFSNCFSRTSLVEIPSGLFSSNNKVINFKECFAFCFDLTNVPEGLFSNCYKAENFMGCFDYCTSLKYMPVTLFDNCPNISDINFCFYNCYSLLCLAPELWNRANVTSYNYCFRNCTKLLNYNNIPAEWK